MTPLVFISYRRQDGTADANALRMRVEAELGPGTVFLDTVSIDTGRVWPDAIRAALDTVDVVLVVISPTTLLKTDEYGRRLIDMETDWVRREVALALESQKRVVPVLVGGAKLPPASVLPASLQTLPDRQACVLRNERWDQDVGVMVEDVRQTLLTLNRFPAARRADPMVPSEQPQIRTAVPAPVVNPSRSQGALKLGFLASVAALLLFAVVRVGITLRPDRRLDAPAAGNYTCRVGGRPMTTCRIVASGGSTQLQFEAPTAGSRESLAFRGPLTCVAGTCSGMLQRALENEEPTPAGRVSLSRATNGSWSGEWIENEHATEFALSPQR